MEDNNIMESVNEDMSKNVIDKTFDESQIISKIQLNDDNRVISCDCDYLETDHVIEMARGNLPVSYLEFCRNLFDYVYKDGALVYAPPLEPATFEEQQNDFNIEVDFRLSMLELGLA